MVLSNSYFKQYFQTNNISDKNQYNNFLGLEMTLTNFTTLQV